MNAFTPRLDILAEAQRGLWPELAQVPAEFTLYGGTAIALQLGHRRSVDFDFFSSQPFDPHELQESIPFLADATVELSKANTLTVFVDRGKRVAVSFFGLPWLRSLRLPWVCADNGLKVASLLDLAATKASTVQGPAEAKDYLDIYALMTLGGIASTEMLKAAGALYGRPFSPLATLKALSHFDDGDLRTLPAHVKSALATAAHKAGLPPPSIPPGVREEPATYAVRMAKGIIDPQSWAYWNSVMGRFPPPPLPVRRFPDGTVGPETAGRTADSVARFLRPPE
jgi:hypothetical protein